jgi:hypothetical protein
MTEHYPVINYSGPLSSTYITGALITTNSLELKLKLSYDRRLVGQAVLVLGFHLEPMTRFLLSDNYEFLGWGALSEERTGL